MMLIQAVGIGEGVVVAAWLASLAVRPRLGNSASWMPLLAAIAVSADRLLAASQPASSMGVTFDASWKSALALEVLMPVVVALGLNMIA